MRSILRVAFLASACWAFSLPAQQKTQFSSDTLRVMSYNLRYANSNPSEAWSKRRPLMAELILKVSPDVMGTQEGLYHQLKDLAADLHDYDWIGLGRDGGSRGEFMAVFYHRLRLEPLAFDHFWLSDTPEVIGSKTWGPALARMVTWVQCRDRQTGGAFYFFNTHFDHQHQAAREKSADLVRRRVAALDTKLPVLLVGDFNAAAGKNKVYDILTADRLFADTWATARERVNEGIGTFNSFKAIQPNGARIDWILNRGEITVVRAEIVTFQRDGQFPSDHFPVVAWLHLTQTR